MCQGPTSKSDKKDKVEEKDKKGRGDRKKGKLDRKKVNRVDGSRVRVRQGFE